MSVITIAGYVTLSRMIEMHGLAAEGECNKQARLAERCGDPSCARRWRVMAEACRQRFGAVDTAEFRFKGKLF